jgi:signal transduction histidine kinase
MTTSTRSGLRIPFFTVVAWLPRLVARVPATVNTKLLVGFLVIVALLIVLGGVGLQVLGRLNVRAEDLVRRQQRIAAYRQFQRDTLLPPSWSWNDTTLEATLRRLSEFRYDLDQLQFVAMDDSEQLARLREDYENFVEIVGQLITEIRAGNAARSRELQLGSAGPLAARLERQTNDLVNKAEADMDVGLAASGEAYATSRWVVIAFSVGSITLALVLGYAISWALIDPVKMMETRLARIASGDFSQRVEVPNRDELGVLARQFNQMAVQLQDSYAKLEERSRDLGQAVDELKALGEVSLAVSSTVDLETVLQTIVARSVDLSDAASGVIYEYSEAEQTFHLRATYRLDDELVALLQTAPLRIGEGASGRAAASRKPVQVADVGNATEYDVPRIRELFERLGYRALLAVPLFHEQRVLGALAVWRRDVGTFSPEVVNLLQTFATQSALAIQNAQLFREIADKSRQLEVASQHKSEFLASMSHELRTPLNAIIGYSELLQEEAQDRQQAGFIPDLEKINAAAKHQLGLINDILDLSKVEAGKMELELADFHLPTAIENALTLVRERAARRGIALQAMVDSRIGDVRADERKIKQVVLNLLSNAIKFTPEAGRIDVRAAPAEGWVEVSVSDTGVGIAPEDQDAVFEEFRQVGTSPGKQEGTGLGLTLCRKFVELHGGRIWVKSQVGAGSTFTFVIPAKPGE